MKNGIPFVSPDSMAVTLDLPNHGPLTGMGIPCGITLIVGGGYHGKSTLLEALELGVYNHIAGDGREYVITRDDAVKSVRRTVEASSTRIFLSSSTTCQTTKTPIPFIPRMPAEVLRKLPMSSKRSRREVICS